MAVEATVRNDLTLGPGVKMLRPEEVHFTKYQLSGGYDVEASRKLHSKIFKMWTDDGIATPCSVNPEDFDLVSPTGKGIPGRGSRFQKLWYLREARRLREQCMGCPVLDECYKDLLGDPFRSGFQAGRVVDPPLDLLHRSVKIPKNTRKGRLL